MNENFLLLYFNIIVKPDFLNFGAGIILCGWSFDGGQSWYVLMDGQLIPEAELGLAMLLGSYCYA